jgi:hypothetical protein
MIFPFGQKKPPIQSQRTIHNGAEIFETIKLKLKEAVFSIKIAAAWFTDDELFQILVNKKIESATCEIEIVLDDNKENYWLPFMDLVNKGAIVKLSKGFGGNGRMHDKFCIIDNKLLISGSYNWSKNARTYNHENIIVSEIAETVKDFNDKFLKLMETSTLYDSINLKGPNVDSEEAVDEIKQQETFTKEFEKVLDELIFSSVVDYDRESLVNKGFERSKKCSGDSNIIYNELNTVYTEMLSSISVSEQKKDILKAKVNTHLEESSTALRKKCSRNKEQLQSDEESKIRGFKKEIEWIKEKNTKIKEDIVKIEQSDIVNNNNRITKLTEEKKAIESETVKMPFRWYVEIPTYLGLGGVFLYILLFYSSAAYILMFAEKNAKTARLLNLPVEEIGIYYSKAIPNAIKSGYTELLPILFVPFFLVCGIIYLKKMKASKYFPKFFIKALCLVMVDGFTAVAVTKSIHENNYLAGTESEHFKLLAVFYDMNFYLVFVFGMLSLLVFDLVVSYLINNMTSRNDVHLKAKRQVKINDLTESIAELSKSNLELNASVINKKALIDHNFFTISSIEKDIELEPNNTRRKVILLENETHVQIVNLENIVKIAHNKIDNELFSFSSHHIKDRINIFLQGWNNYIYSYYSKGLSEGKVQEAKGFANTWLREHFVSNGNAILKTIINENVQ